MRNNVIKFLESLPEAPEDQFNQALLLYMKSPVPNPGLVRSYNQQGYSPQRLNELLYDLKKAFEISDSAIVIAPKVVKIVQKTPLLPEFSKGIKGNQERKAYLLEHNITSESFKNDDMDKAIEAYIKNINVDVVDEELVMKFESALNSDDSLIDEILEKAATSNQATKDDIQKIKESFDLKVAEKVKEDLESFNKIKELITAGEVPPVSLIKEIYNDTEMSDENALAILEEATKALVPDIKVSENDTDNAKSDTDVSKNETLKEVTETSKSDAEKK